MFCRSITSFICIFVAVVVATVHNDSRSVTGSELEVTDHLLTTESPESSTMEPDQESITVDLSALIDAGDGAIVTLVTADTRLAVHKAVLTARSPVFSAKLQRMTLEASSDQLAIPDVEGTVLRHLVAYMYTLQAPQEPSIATKLLAAADTYGLPALKAHCEQQVAAQLSVETAVTAAVLAVRHSCSSLMQAAIAFIRTRIFHVMATQGWADAMNSQPEDLMKVIQLLSDPPAEASVPAPAASGATHTTQPPSDQSDHSGVTPASAAPTTAARHTATPDYAAVCPLWTMPAEEKNRRLFKAAERGANSEMEALLAAGADVEARDENRWTALHWAAHEGHVEVARRLLAAGAAVEARTNAQSTPLHLAAENGRTAVVQLLVQEASADPNARDVGRWTPLHRAASAGAAEAAAALLQAGADKEAIDIRGRTPLDDARNNQQLIEILT